MAIINIKGRINYKIQNTDKFKTALKKIKLYTNNYKFDIIILNIIFRGNNKKNLKKLIKKFSRV